MGAADPARRVEVGVAFATKIVLARRVVERAVAVGVPAGCLLADDLPGDQSHPAEPL